MTSKRQAAKDVSIHFNNKTVEEIAGIVVDGLRVLHKTNPAQVARQRELNVFEISASILSGQFLQQLPGAQTVSVQDITKNSKVKVTKTLDGTCVLHGSLSALNEAKGLLEEAVQDSRITRKNVRETARKQCAESSHRVQDAVPRAKRKLDKTEEASPSKKQSKMSEVATGKTKIKVEKDTSLPTTPVRTSGRCRPRVSYAALASGRDPLSAADPLSEEDDEVEEAQVDDERKLETGKGETVQKRKRGRPRKTTDIEQTNDDCSQSQEMSDNHTELPDKLQGDLVEEVPTEAAESPVNILEECLNVSSIKAEVEADLELATENQAADGTDTETSNKEGKSDAEAEENEEEEDTFVIVEWMDQQEDEDYDLSKDGRGETKRKGRRKGRRGRRKVNPDTLVCSKCDYVSATTTGLQAHMYARHPKAQKFTCDICFIKHTYHHTLRNHRRTHYSSDGKLTSSAIAMFTNALQKHGLKEEDVSEEMMVHYKKLCDQKLLKNTEEAKIKLNESEEMNGVKKEEELNMLSSDNEQMTKTETDIGSGAMDDGTSEGENCSRNTEGLPTLSEAKSRQSQKKFGEFPCAHCGTILSTENFRAKHIQTFHSENRVSSKRTRSYRAQNKDTASKDNRQECPYCDFVSYRPQTFTMHIRSHNKPALFKCDQCEYTNVTKGEVNRHKRNAHAAKNYICDKCPTKFRNRILLNQHVKQKHLKVYQTICEHCGKSMTSANYKEHLRRFHTPGVEKVKSMICNKCGKKLRSRTHFENHERTAHPDANCPEDQEVTEALMVNDEANDDKSSACRLCGFRAKTPREVVNHIIRMHAERRHSCPQCGAGFPRKEVLERHVRIYHDDTQRCQCPECGRQFRSKQYLRGHMMRMHMAELPNKCEVCGKGFYHRQALLQHIELHKPAEERAYPYHCITCKKKFRFKSAYSRHLVEHSGERPYSCLLCSKTFALASSLEQHLYVHTEERPFVCRHCSKAFKMKKYLDVHMLSHAAQNIVCQHCGRIFLRKEALQKHICHCVVISENGKLEPRPASVVLEELAPTDNIDGNSTVYVCSNCGEVFQDMSLVPSHVCQAAGAAIEPTDGEEADSNEFICMACGAQFEEEEVAHQHLCETSDVAQGEAEQGAESGAVSQMQEVPASEVLTEETENTTTVILEQAGEEIVAEVGSLVANFAPAAATSEGQVDVVSGEGQSQGQGEASYHESQVFVIQPDDVPGHLRANNVIPSEQVSLVTGTLVEGQDEEDGTTETASHTPMEMQIYAYLCKICRKMFTSQESAALHMAEHEQVQDADQKTIASMTTAEVVVTSQSVEAGSGITEEESDIEAMNTSTDEPTQEWTEAYLY